MEIDIRMINAIMVFSKRPTKGVNIYKLRFQVAVGIMINDQTTRKITCMLSALGALRKTRLSQVDSPTNLKSWSVIKGFQRQRRAVRLPIIEIDSITLEPTWLLACKGRG